MKLLDRMDELAKINLAQEIKLGTKGSSFVYCGPLSSFPFSEIEGYFEEYKQKCIYGSHEARPIYIPLPSVAQTITANEIVERQKRLDKAWKKRIEAYKKKAETWKPIQDRDILEEYGSIIDENARIIIIEGYEPGKFFDREEYIEYHKNGRTISSICPAAIQAHSGVIDRRATGLNIKRLMQKNGITAQNSYNTLKVKKDTFYSWISGVNLPVGKNLEKLTEHFKCDADDILVYEETSE